MKKMNKKGFSLIELLAVIVILSIIMTIAVFAVMPIVEQTRVTAFETNANSIVSIVRQVSLADGLSGKNYSCYDLDYLDTSNQIDKIPVGTNNYQGLVILDSSGEYTLHLQDMASGHYFKITTTGEIQFTDEQRVAITTKPTDFYITCSDYATANSSSNITYAQ